MPGEQNGHQLNRPKPEADNPFDLLPPWLEAELPSVERIREDADPMIYCAYFSPVSLWQWFAFSFDRQYGLFSQGTFHGYVLGYEAEVGSFSLEEFRSQIAPFINVARLVMFEKMRFSELKEQLRAKGVEG